MITYHPVGRIHAAFFGYAPLDRSSFLLLVTQPNGTGTFNLLQVHCWTEPCVRAVDVALQRARRGRPIRNVHDEPARNHTDDSQLCVNTALDDSLNTLLTRARIVQLQGHRGGAGRVLRYTYTHPLRLDRQGGRLVAQAVPDAVGTDGVLPRHPLLWDARWSVPQHHDRQDLASMLGIFRHAAAPFKPANVEGTGHG